MNINVKTLEGAYLFSGLASSTTVSQLVEIVQQRLANTALASAPLRLVCTHPLLAWYRPYHSTAQSTGRPSSLADDMQIYKESVVREGTLVAAGIEEGASLVALAARPWLDACRVEYPKPADKETIIDVTTEEARSRGTLESASVSAAAAAAEAAAAGSRWRRGPQMHAMEAQILEMLEQAAPGVQPCCSHAYFSA